MQKIANMCLKKKLSDNAVTHIKQLPSLGCAEHLLLDPLHLHYSQVFENMSKFIVDLLIYFLNSISPTVPSGRGLALTLHIRAWTKPKILWSAGITSTTSGSASVSSSRYLSFISPVECVYYSILGQEESSGGELCAIEGDKCLCALPGQRTFFVSRRSLSKYWKRAELLEAIHFTRVAFVCSHSGSQVHLTRKRTRLVLS